MYSQYLNVEILREFCGPWRENDPEFYAWENKTLSNVLRPEPPCEKGPISQATAREGTVLEGGS